MHDADRSAALDALNRIRSSGFLGAAPKLEAFLRYVVTQELDEGGGEINAYAIAVNALDRPRSFDPRNDPVVRVFAGRLRSALTDYYQGPGKHDPVRIGIPKGTYRPEFRHLAGVSSAPGTDLHKRRGLTGLGRSKVAAFAVAIVILIALFEISLVRFFEQPQDVASEDHIASTGEAGIAFPVVEIGPFNAGIDTSRRDLLIGIRQQLVQDLSQFRTLRVRDMPLKSDVNSLLTESDYSADGRLVRSGGEEMLEIVVRDTARDTVLWSQMLEIPQNDAEYQDLLLTTIRAIASRLAGISGIVRTDAVRRLEERRDRLADTQTSDYECIVKFYVFGQRRTPGTEEAARQCLEELTAKGSRDSMIWAFWSLTKHMDWMRHGGDGSMQLLEESLNAARKAIDLDPTNANAHEFAAMTYVAMDEMDAARTSYEHALSLNPSKPDFYVHYGSYFIRLGEWERGVELVRKGIGLSPSPQGWMYLPLSVDAFRRDDFEEALRIAETIIETGDRRGYLFALAAAIALGDKDAEERYLVGYRSAHSESARQALRGLAKMLPDRALLEKYESTLASVLTL